MSVVVTGAVNGVPTTAEVATTGASPVTIPFFPGSVSAPLDVDTDGSGLHVPNHRVAVISGNVSGRDHFPFAVANTTLGTTTIFPLSLEYATKWLYRVKRWRVQASGSFTDHFETPGPPATNVVDFSLSFDFGFVREVPDESEDGFHYAVLTEESELVLNWSRSSEDAAVVDLSSIVTTDIQNIVYSGLAISLVDWNFQLVFMGWNSGSIYPFVRLRLLLQDGSGTIDVRTNPLSGYSATGTNLTCDDLTAPLYYKNLQTSGNRAELITAKASITPFEFWPYATTTGDPVYDTSTGAPLLNPLS